MNLYIPVEVKDRELYAKILLAKYAAENGFNVILGKKNDVNRLVLSMPPGVYLGLGIAQNYNNFFEKLSNLGHIIAVGEEEGLITYSDKMYLDMRISHQTIQNVDLIFTWGEENYHIISAGRDNTESKLCITGNPRFDLLKPDFSGVYDDHISLIKSKYDKFILVCTSFPSCNHFIKKIDYLKSLIDKKTLTSEKSIANFKRYQKVKSSTFQSFLDAIPVLAETYSDTDIVIRPHPSENKEVYQIFSDKYKNVFIESSFSVHPWILSSMGVVHHYCTTSIEAFASDVPSFSLRPVKDELSEKEIPFKCSNECPTVEILIKKINNIVFSQKDYKPNPQLKKEYEKYVLNMGDTISSELIIQKIISYLNTNPSQYNHNFHQLFNEYIGRLGFLLRSLIRTMVMKKKIEIKYTTHKFDRLSLGEVKDVLSFYANNSNVNLRCRRLDKDFVRISKE